jgi:subtilisin family serine protease
MEMEQEGKSGCVQVGVFILMAGWILTITAIVMPVIWSLEQALFQGTPVVPDVRWAIGLGYGLGVLVPAAILWAVMRGSSGWQFYRAFALAGLFAMLLAPARLPGLTAAQETAVLQIVLALLFLLIDRLVSRKEPTHRSGGWNMAAALLVAGLVGLPWVLWGALGSVLDTLLNLLAALAFGAAAARILQPVFDRPAGESRTVSNHLLDGFVAALVLLVMVEGLASNGNQGLLALSVPVLGWVLSVLHQSRGTPDGKRAANGRTLALLAGLAAFWPMAFIDPDELAAIVTLGAGELIQWANMAGGVSLAIGILASLAALLVGSLRPARRARVTGVVAGLTWLVLAILYGLVGQPGLYGERLFVIFKDQADLSATAQIQDPTARRMEVYRTLVARADQTQAGIRSTLDRFRIPYQAYYLENAIEVQAGPLVRWWLERRPEVDRVLNNPILRPLPADVPVSRGEAQRPSSPPWNVQMIHADLVREELGVTGKGIVVGQSDSGMQGDHPELADSYRGSGGQNDYNWFDPWYHSTAPRDIGGHGTHTLGTILGNTVGIAPDAQWIGCVNLARNLGNPALYLDCMQFMLAPFPEQGDPLRDGRPELGANVLNNSWGCPPVEGCDPNALLQAVNHLRAAGVFVVASAGNDGDGGCGTVKDPIALYDSSYTVGAVNESGNVVSFSSLGPVEVDGSERVKPDIAAPGQDVLSSFPGGTYATESGTSMAGPHLVGVVALMWSANPALIGNIERTEQILDETAMNYTGSLPTCVSAGRPNDAVGYGIVDAYAAVKEALAVK